MVFVRMPDELDREFMLFQSHQQQNQAHNEWIEGIISIVILDIILLLLNGKIVIINSNIQ